MKTKALFISFLLLMGSLPFLFSQEEGFNYQAVARNNEGEILSNTNVNLRFQILSGSQDGPVEYQETFSPLTSEFGLINIVLGTGNNESGDFSSIDWSAGPYYLVVEMDGAKIDTSRFEAVPFSKVATDMELSDLKDVNALSPGVQQLLGWDGSEWTPVDMPEYSGGAGIEVSGNTITNTLPDEEITLTGTGGTTITGSYPDFTINSSAGGSWTENSDGVFYNGNVGINNSAPNSALSIGNNGKFTVSSEDGDVNFYDPNASITFPTIAGESSSMINMFRTGTTNGTRMLIAHSPGFPDYGLRYNDTIDAFTYIGASQPVMHLGLIGDRRVGIGTEEPEAKTHILYNSAIGRGQLKLTENQADFARLTMNSTEYDDFWDIAAVTGGNDNNARLNFFHSEAGDILTLRSTERVGINDQTPAAPLEVRNSGNDIYTLRVNHSTNTDIGNYQYGGYFNTQLSTSNSSSFLYGTFIQATNSGGNSIGTYGYAVSESSGSSYAMGVRGYAHNANGSGNAYAIYGVVGISTTSGDKFAGFFNGDVYSTGNFIASDEKLKEKLTPSGSVLNKVLSLEVENYNYRKKSYAHMALPEGQQVGFTAQNVKSLMPELVKSATQPAPTKEEVEAGMTPGEEVKFEAVNYTGMIPYLVKSIQEQQAIIAEKDARIQELENRLLRIEQRMERLGSER
jgi:hypothetical protein